MTGPLKDTMLKLRFKYEKYKKMSWTIHFQIKYFNFFKNKKLNFGIVGKRSFFIFIRLCFGLFCTRKRAVQNFSKSSKNWNILRAKFRKNFNNLFSVILRLLYVLRFKSLQYKFLYTNSLNLRDINLKSPKNNRSICRIMTPPNFLFRFFFRLSNLGRV